MSCFVVFISLAVMAILAGVALSRLTRVTPRAEVIAKMQPPEPPCPEPPRPAPPRAESPAPVRAAPAPMPPAPVRPSAVVSAAPPPPRPAAPARPMAACDGDRFWVPLGESAQVDGRRVGGGLYVGSGLAPVAVGYRGEIEPALLDPRLKVSWTRPDREGQLMGYWPSYSGIDPASRAAYLSWLSQGRNDPATAIGYVFLYFYGIERRVLVDAQASERARGEVDGLLAEVERLLGIYGDNRSFRGYAGSFLALARLLHRPIDPAELQPPRRSETWEVPLSLRIALGAFAKDGRPVPPDWAYAWAVCSPEVRLRTPAQRCPREFEELFRIRYAESFRGGGLKVVPNKTPIAMSYRPASPSFLGSVSISLKELPDVAGLAGPLRKLQEIADRCHQELDVYSRWVGRTGDGLSPAAVALLPPELGRSRESDEARKLAEWIEERLGEDGLAVVPGADLAARWPCQEEGKLARREAELLAAFLGQRGYGLEPDVRLGGPPPGGGPAVLFRLGGEGDAAPGPTYPAAAVLLHLAVVVSAADGVVSASEEAHLLAHLESALHLSPAERTRLKAHLHWLLAAPPKLAGLKKRIEPLDEARRREIGQFLVTVAGADGQVGAEELKLLSKIYPLLGLEAQAVYSDVHALASSEPPPAAEPVTVRAAGPAPAGFPIPAASPARPAGGIALDPRKVQAKLAETEAIAEVLEGIFGAEEEVKGAALPPAARAAAPVAEPAGPPPVAGLDGPHSALLRRLAEKAAWERVEVERLASGLGLMPEGALEIINESAFERCGAPVVEGEETLEVDAQVLEEMLA